MILTKKQKLILDFITLSINENGYAPSIQEIGDQFGLSSPATTHKHLTNLEAKGLIRRQPNLSRAIELVRHDTSANNGVSVPLLGVIAAGQPIESYDTHETISIPEDMMGRKSTYVLKVRGESMIDEQIRHGDFVVVEHREEARDGETVVALVRGESVTLKKFFMENGNVRLQPANDTMEPIIVPADQVMVQGVVIGLLRKF